MQEEPIDSAPRAFEPGTYPSKNPGSRSWKPLCRVSGGRGNRWIFIHSQYSPLDPEGTGKAVPAPRKRSQGTTENSWKTLPFGITLPRSAGMLQKLGVRGREGTRGMKNSQGKMSVRASPLADPPPRTHTGPPRLCSRRRSRIRPAAPHGTRKGGTPADVGLGTHCTRHNLPRISCPWWRLQASLYSQLPNSWWLFQKRVSICSTALHPKGLPTENGPSRGCLLALKSRFLNGG